MQIPENPDNNDIRNAIIQLREELGAQIGQLSDRVDQIDDRLEKLDYKFDVYQKGTDGMVRMATTIIIATASVVVLSSLSPAVMAIATAFATSKTS
ncbi:MAG: hypothetical protein HC895_12345 [Leptolyngbyaceae cyanobacterium SM1_3_5]|nr:hypothetical protein [Leptolyngbyaceae cyanobacterium SM1_3_5]